MATVLQTSPSSCSHVPSLLSLREPNRDHHLKPLVVILSVVTEICLPNRWLAMDLFVAICWSRNVITQPLLSTGRSYRLHYSGFQAVLTAPLLSKGHIRHNILTPPFHATWRSPEHIPQMVPVSVWSCCKLCLCASGIFSGIQ
jgi:hypothetical protein